MVAGKVKGAKTSMTFHETLQQNNAATDRSSQKSSNGKMSMTSNGSGSPKAKLSSGQTDPNLLSALLQAKNAKDKANQTAYRAAKEEKRLDGKFIPQAAYRASAAQSRPGGMNDYLNNSNKRGDKGKK